MFNSFLSKILGKEKEGKEEEGIFDDAVDVEEEGKDEEGMFDDAVDVEEENLFNDDDYDSEDEDYKQQNGNIAPGNIDFKIQYFYPERTNIYNSEDLRSQKEHMDDWVVVTGKDYEGQTCITSKIIRKLYNIINKNCFLHGAFVFQDENGLLLNALTHNCGVNRWRASAGDIITHNTFMNQKKFGQLNHNSIIDSEFLMSMKLYYPRANVWRYYQYENFIKNEGGNYETLNYLCNPKCNDNEKLEECTKDRKAPKSVILFYPFMIKLDNITKRYLYLKLESSSFISVEHAVEASVAYTTDVTDNSGYPRRRERLKRGEVRYNNDELRVRDNQFYNSLNLTEYDRENIRFYNHNVRSNKELFIPQSITNRLIKE